jgi:serine/threonine protein kinase/Tfp pilus assembly protein PilF
MSQKLDIRHHDALVCADDHPFREIHRDDPIGLLAEEPGVLPGSASELQDIPSLQWECHPTHHGRVEIARDVPVGIVRRRPTVVSPGDDVAGSGCFAHDAKAIARRVSYRVTHTTPQPDERALPAGVLGDRFVVERELGRGGMATVYLARETKHARQVAIKVLNPTVSAAFGAERFLREIGIAARLSHPHLVPLIDSGEAQGYLYYISVFVPGGSLRDRLARDPKLPVQEAIRIAEEVGAGLDFAHRAGIVHRDVKPENILFADGHAQLADFGIARVFGMQPDVEPTTSGSNSLTAPGITMGTPAYMSPEQAVGETDLDARSDVYSLACVLYEMLTGAPPLLGRTPRETIAKHVTEKPRRLRTLRPETPQHVEDAVHKALEKDPARRFKAVTEFMGALKAERVTRPRSTGYLRGVAVLPFVNASAEQENEYLSDGITDELINALAKLPGIRVASRSSVFALKGKPQDVRAIGALLDTAYVLEGSVRRAGQQLRITAQLSSTDDGRLLWSQRYDRQLDDVFAIQDEIAQTIVNTLRAKQLGEPIAPAAERHTNNARAYTLYLKGRFEWNQRTQQAIANAIKYFEEAIKEEPSYALAYTGLADSYALQLDYRSIPVDEGHTLAQKYARHALSLDDTLAEAHASLAWSLFIYSWEWQTAEREFRRAIGCDPRYAPAHLWYQFLLCSRGATDQALVEGLTAVELDPGSVAARRAVAWTYIYGRRYDQARTQLERAMAMNPNAEETYREMGVALSLDGDHDEAVRVLRDAVQMPEAGSYTRAWLGYALARGSQEAEARDILRSLEQQQADGYVSPVAFATIHLGLGEAEAAIGWAERAFEERRGWLAYVRVNPVMDPMRDHPRFEALVAKMKLS